MCSTSIMTLGLCQILPQHEPPLIYCHYLLGLLWSLCPPRKVSDYICIENLCPMCANAIIYSYVNRFWTWDRFGVSHKQVFKQKSKYWTMFSTLLLHALDMSSHSYAGVDYHWENRKNHLSGKHWSFLPLVTILSLSELSIVYIST